jgi:hypothetical protein
MERQSQRGWRNEVAGKVKGFPPDPHVHHMHPFGVIDNFRIAASRHPRITMEGRKVELPFLDKFSGRGILNEDCEAAARELSCEPYVLRAIAEVESGKKPFFLPGDVHAPGDDVVAAVIYERNYFHKLTRGSFDRADPEISYPRRYVDMLDDGE